MQKPLMIVIAAGFLIAVIFMYFNRPGPCATMKEETTQKLSLSVDVIKAQGALVIGGEKVQDVSDGAQKVGEHLMACCDAQHGDHPLPPDQYLACINGAKDYEAKIIQITNIVKEADTAKQEGKTGLVDQKVAEAKATVVASASIERELGKLAQAAQTARPAPAIDNAKPWEGARVVIKVKNGKSVVVDAKTVSTNWGYCGGEGLILDYGQKIPFKNMQSFTVLDEKPTLES